MSDNPSEDAAAVTPADNESTAGNAMEESNEATAKEQTTPMEEDAEEEVQSKDKDDKESAASEKAGDDDGGGSLVMDESSRQSAASSSHAASEQTAASDEDAATPRGSVDRMRTQPIDREIEAAPLGDEADYEIDDAADDSLVITGDSAGRGSGRAASKGSGYYRRLADEGVDDDAGSWQKTPTSSGKKASRAHQTYRPVKNAGPKGEIDPLWLVPFDYGWTRELALRATYVSSGQQADVYYKPPAGKKLRSMVEIERYLTENSIDLTSANFTFRKEPIYKEPFETVRAAKPGSGSFGRGKDTTPTGSTPKPKVKMVVSSSGKRGRGRPSKEASRGSATSSPLRPGTPATGGGASGDAAESPIVFKTSQPVVLSGGDTPSSSPAPPREVRAVARKHMGKRSAHHSMAAPDAKRARTIAEAVTAAQAEDSGERRLCGLTCPARGGTPPSLHCEVCMCLFHPQCVGWDPHRRAGFVCKGCRAVESKLQQGVVAVAPAPPPPVVPMSSGVGRTIMTAAPAPRVITPISDPIPNAATPRGALGSAAPPPKQVKMPANFDLGNLSGQLITLPPTISGKLNLTKAVNLKWNGQSYVVPPNCFINTPDGLKVLLPANTLAGASSPATSLTARVQTSSSMSLNVTGATPPPERTLGTLRSILQPPPPLHTPSGGGVVRSQASSTSTTRVVSPITISPPSSTTGSPKAAPRNVKVAAVKPCHFSKLHAGLDAMLHVFSFLQPADLLRARLVCRSWNKAASHSEPWRTVRLQKLTVTNWEKASTFMLARHTQILDLRGSSRRCWSALTASLRRLVSLRRVYFPQCPASVVAALAEACPALQLLRAEALHVDGAETGATQIWSENAVLDLGVFGRLTHLSELRLRGVTGINLAAFSFAGGLDGLDRLSKLRVLSLTTLREVPHNEFSFLASLTQLEVLELGDCFLWKTETFEQLSKLTSLKFLRLENGGDVDDSGLGGAISSLMLLDQLELIRWQVSAALSEALRKMTWLTSLSIWPDTDTSAAEINRHMRAAVSAMPFLKQVEWGVTMAAAGDGAANCLAFPAAGPPAAPQNGDVHPPPAPVEYVGINDLVDTLHSHLPDTKIRVFKVPAAQKPRPAAATPTK